MLALIFINGNYYYCWHGGAIPSGVEEPWGDFLRVGGYLEWPPSSPTGYNPTWPLAHCTPPRGTIHIVITNDLCVD